MFAEYLVFQRCVAVTSLSFVCIKIIYYDNTTLYFCQLRSFPFVNFGCFMAKMINKY